MKVQKRNKKSKEGSFREISPIDPIKIFLQCPNYLDMQIAIGTYSVGISLISCVRKAKIGFGQIFFSSQGASDAFLINQ